MLWRCRCCNQRTRSMLLLLGALHALQAFEESNNSKHCCNAKGVAESCYTRSAPSRYHSAASFYLDSYLPIQSLF
ncbi:hypothetical protein LZ30DRAFT_743996 [Colletotrichum cereale]|nr:hypothetical protein LZ30DRAFT_743996 [Colletotrichum cereale]